MDRCLIIAEAGVNHNGDLATAKALIDAAKKSGADVVKFQTFKSDLLASKGAEQAAYQQKNTGVNEPQRAMLKKLELSNEAFQELFNYCNSQEIEFMSTPFDIASAQYLDRLGVKRFKLSSGDLTDVPLIRAVSGLGKPMIISTGMATLGDVERAVDCIENETNHNKDISILHCTTEYPAPYNEVNLRAIETLKLAFPSYIIGYSDHTEGSEASIAAVALGAKIIEKHLTLDRRMEGPDHLASMEPDDFSRMIKSIRNIELALGSGRKAPSASEYPNMPIARKSLYAKTDIQGGDIFSELNLTTARPDSGISAAHWDQYIGKAANKNYKKGDKINF